MVVPAAANGAADNEHRRENLYGGNPAQLILNNSIQLSKQKLRSQRVIYPPDTSNTSQQIALSDRMDESIAGQNVLLKVARDKQSKTDFHALVVYDPSITEYPINSYVLFTPPVGRSDKLLPRHRGPFQVMDKTHSIYTIEDLVNGKRITTHIYNLRPFNYDPERTRPVDIARQTAQDFFFGDRNRRSTMEFLVRWEDFTGADSREPYAGLRHAEKLHEYLRVHK